MVSIEVLLHAPSAHSSGIIYSLVLMVFMVLVTIILNDFDVGFGQGCLSLIVGHREMEMIFAQRCFGGNVDMLMEFSILYADVFTAGIALFDFIGSALFVDFHENALYKAFCQDIGLQVKVIALLGLHAVFMPHLGKGNLRCRRGLLTSGERQYEGKKYDETDDSFFFMINVF